MIDFSTIEGFEWDVGNIIKNLLKHFVTTDECEELFFNHPHFVVKDEKHSTQEERFQAFGFTNGKRLLHLTFTLRNNKIRVISARPMSKGERKIYEQFIRT
jgi:uncharacterized protein